MLKDVGELIKKKLAATEAAAAAATTAADPTAPSPAAGDLAQELHATKAEMRRVKKELEQLKAAQTSGRMGETVGTGGSIQVSAGGQSGRPRHGETAEQTISRLRQQRDELLKLLPLNDEQVDGYLKAAKGIAAVVKDHITLLDLWEKRQHSSLEEYYNAVPRRQSEALEEYQLRVGIPEPRQPTSSPIRTESTHSSPSRCMPPPPPVKTDQY